MRTCSTCSWLHLLKGWSLHKSRADSVSAVRGALHKLSNAARLQTEEKESSLRQFAALAHSLPQVVWQADAEGRITYVNKDWFSQVPGQAVDSSAMARRVTAEDRHLFTASWRISLDTGVDLDLRCRVDMPGHETARWCDFKAVLAGARGHAGSCWIGTIFDVHEMVVAARQMERALLEERHAKAELERLVATRDQFLRMVSHELRSPLSAISGWAEIMLKKSMSDPLVHQAASVIRRNAQIQGRLINDLIDMNAVAAGRLVLDRAVVDVADLARGVVDSLLHDAQRRGVGLTWAGEPDLAVDGDVKRLAQVIANVVGNALKFTESGGRVDVRARRIGGRVAIEVTDTGCGISAPFLAKVFDGLQQEDASTTRRKGGLGIGLAISRGLVELHGGTIAASSKGAGQGATFNISLPACERENLAAAMPSRTPGRRERDLTGLSVLLVDDEDDARFVAEVALTTLGARVCAVSSGAAVLQKLEADRYDVLVSDIGMPELDGVALISQIRRRFRGTAGDLPAVALTAFAMEVDRQIALAAGFDDYIAKPISLDALASAVSRATQRGAREQV